MKGTRLGRANMNDYLKNMMREFSRIMVDPANAVSDRNHLIEQHMRILGSEELRTSMGEFLAMNPDHITAPNRSLPVIPLHKENMITIDDILQAGPDFVHEGKFLLCRTILPEARMNAVALVVDFPNDQRCLRLVLHNFSPVVRPGTILAIMHPWLELSIEIPAAIRVDNPVHVHIFNGDESLIRDLVWKVPLPKESGVTKEQLVRDPAWEGNQYFAAKNFPKAIAAYSKAIEAHPKTPTLYSNRALAYLKMEKPLAALEDAETGLKLDQSNVKLLYRKGKALIQLKRYDEAATFLEKAGPHHKDEKDFVNLVKISKRMRDESKNGNYDIVKMIEEANRCKLLDNHADYYALDKFEIKEVPGKGHGLVAKAKINPGTLLIACKAFVFADASEAEISIDWATVTANSPNFVPLVRKASHKLLEHPELADDFYKLYAGKKLGRLEKADHDNPVDTDRIGLIVRLNCFGAQNYLKREDSDASNRKEGDGGLWILPSYLNHSCVDCNCFRTFIGDFIFVRATKVINPGEELLLEYITSSDPYEVRRLSLSHQYGFDCTCRLCQADRNDPPEISKRFGEIRKIVAEVEQRVVVSPVAIFGDAPMLKSLLKEVIKYRPDSSLNFLMLEIKKLLSTAVGRSEPRYSQQLFEDVFDSYQRAGDLFPALLSAKVLQVIVETSAMRNEAEAAKWVSRAKKLAKILFGDERVVNMIE